MRKILFLAAVTALSLRAEEWTKSYTVGSSPELEVSTDDGNIVVKPGASGRIQVRVLTTGLSIPGDVDVIEHQAGDRVTLQVKMARHWRWGGWNNRSLRVELEAPRTLRGRFTTGDGNVSVSGIEGDLRFHTGDGNIEARDLAGSMEARTGDGNVHADGRFESLQVSTGDGNVEIRAAPGSRVSSGWRISTGDGNVRLDIPGTIAADLDAHTGDGRIHMDLPLNLAPGEQKRNHVRGQINGGGLPVNIRTGDGSIHLGRV
ncbi:MAG TPA: DUF4097 family beta strand repeat-containing protein [Bryobacteraceae bacterium]|nr:DUF4097 family beta strand repeat-containing protein [Bryobacteraceae bacterium]